MKKIKLLTIALLTSMPIFANAMIIDCYSDEFSWTHVSIQRDTEDEFIFTIMDTNNSARYALGSVANLKLKKIVFPGGNKFLNYKGNFVGEIPQKTLSVYLSEDFSKLVRYADGRPHSYNCY